MRTKSSVPLSLPPQRTLSHDPAPILHTRMGQGPSLEPAWYWTFAVLMAVVSFHLPGKARACYSAGNNRRVQGLDGLPGHGCFVIASAFRLLNAAVHVDVCEDRVAFHTPLLMYDSRQHCEIGGALDCSPRVFTFVVLVVLVRHSLTQPWRPS